MKDQLFILKPGYFKDDRGPLFCCDAAPIEGQLSFYPQLRQWIDVIYIDAQRPRRALVERLGQDNQESPVLLIAPGHALKDSRVAYQTYGAQRFINDPTEISKYLSTQYGLGLSSAIKPAATAASERESHG